MKRKMIFIPKTGKIETVSQDDSLQAIYNKLECSTIDMFTVGESETMPDVSYDFICDDEGMFKHEDGEDNINGFSIAPYRLKIFRQPLFGHILMCAVDNNTGDYVDINVAEAKRILKKLYIL